MNSTFERIKKIQEILDEKAYLQSSEKLPFWRRLVHFWVLVAKSFQRNRGPVRAAALGQHQVGLAHLGQRAVQALRHVGASGALAKLLGHMAAERVNILSVEHHREGIDLPVTGTEVELTLATRDEEHCAEVLQRMAEWGYVVERVR